MIILNLSPGTTSTDKVGFSIVLNTNNNIKENDSTIQFLEPGLYEINGIATITSTGSGNYGLKIQTNDEVDKMEAYNKASASDETTTIPLHCVIEVDRKLNGKIASVSIIPVGSPTIVSGNMSIVRIV